MAKPIVINQSATTTIIPAVAGRTPIITAYVLSVTTETVIRFDDTDDVALSGPMTITAKGQLIAPYNPDGHCEGNSGKGIKLVFVSGSGTLGGNLNYNN